MKIHVVTQTFPPRIGGMQTLMYSLSEGLSQKKYDVFVYPDHKFKNKTKLKIYHVAAPKFLRPFIKRLLINFNFNEQDVVICDTWKSVQSLPKKIKNVYCFAIGQEFLKNKRDKNIYKIQKAFNRSKFIISITNFTQDLVVSKCSVDKKKLRIIFPTFSIKPVKLPNYKKKTSCINLISICRIENRKGLIETAKALINIKDKKNLEFIWNIIGDGPSKKLLQKIVEESNIKNNVTFHGFVSEKRKIDFLLDSDLFLMPGYMAEKSIEGFGIVYAEAASYGIPSIGGVDGGAPEAVIHNETGWCVDPKNSKLLEETISKAIENKKLREKFGENAKIYFKKRFSSEIAFYNLINLLKS